MTLTDRPNGLIFSGIANRHDGVINMSNHRREWPIGRILNEIVKIPNNRRKDFLLILFLILCVMGQPVLSSTVLCFAGSDHVEVEFEHDGSASFSRCRVASSANSQDKGFDIAPNGKGDQCFDVPMSGNLALNNIIPFDQTSPQIKTLTIETYGSAFGGPRTLHGNAILLDQLPFETSVSLSLQNTVLVI